MSRRDGTRFYHCRKSCRAGLRVRCVVLDGNWTIVLLSSVAWVMEDRLKGRVVSTMCQGLCDYEIEERGDVGSWTRAAVMQECSNVISAFQNTDTLKPVILEFVGLLVCQFCERLEKLRVAALGALRRVVARLAETSENNELVTLQAWVEDFESTEQTATRPSQFYPKAVSLLEISLVRPYALRGLVSSAGGVGPQKEAAMDALCNFFRGLGTRRGQLLNELASELLSVLHSKHERLVSPAVGVLESVLAHGCFASLAKSTTLRWGADVALALRKRVPGTSDMQRLRGIIAVLSEIAGFPHREDQDKALEGLMLLLGHSLPRIRQRAAEELYVRILEMNQWTTRPGLDVVEGILFDNSWDEDGVREARNTRDSLCDALEIAPPRQRAKGRAS
eukprot:Plantae.Rhodophyta-Rhodochaete_pulchella.ctg19864.p1 GENE.Plantae.Rhodophyta-Rhodochaete_pulchella.ctg19864~~Plantae.Rhodophyta-Rhodochaete_pulchella.ctg19864.p1  ORF type:complete len:392 (-),score=36.99 Plantae.Rhodophyta-Rhodochaete_pulchella.ctg19864:137-1312(-)